MKGTFKKITEEDEKILEQFPPYDGKGEFVGTRDYWRFVFEQETNRDPKLHEAFCELHKKIVDEVIQFCKEHDLKIDEFNVGADGILGSIPYGEWCPCTDSSMSMCKMVEGENGMSYTDRTHPFLYQM